MFNQETSSSTNYLIIACMLISFARFLFFQLNVQMDSKAKKPMELFFDLLFTSVCVFITKCGLFAGLNFEAIRVVLIDVLLLVYLIYVRPYRMDHYKSTVIILTLNSVANLPHSHESSHVQPFFACLFEKATESECLSHCPLTSRSCLKDAPHSSSTQPSLSLTHSQGWKTCWVLCFWHAVIIQELPYRWFCSLCASLPKHIEMFTEMPWQNYFRSRKFLTKIQALSLHVLSQTGGDIQALKKKKPLTINHLFIVSLFEPFVGSLFFL